MIVVVDPMIVGKQTWYLYVYILGDRPGKKKLFNIYVREKRSKQNICIMRF